MTTKFFAGLLSLMLLVSVFQITGCASTGGGYGSNSTGTSEKSFEQRLKEQEMMEEKAMSK